ncbi:LuxR C-terminal-related transcriptional regulator [Rhodoblastus sp.]|uniref:LuxR C-terminal-related transcriptional regulator n=1 Tax=Rhodoblastus sp. TaxID=1962975 RepID=UPI003F9BB524
MSRPSRLAIGDTTKCQVLTFSDKENETSNAIANTNKDTGFAVLIVERNIFFRECLQKSMGGYSLSRIDTCSSLSELTKVQTEQRASLVVLSVVSLTEEEAEAEIALLSDLDPSMRSIVLAKTDDLNDALTALRQGANGYISMGAGFDIFVQALRFVAAGGTYVPPECLLAAKKAQQASSEHASVSGITTREMEVIQAVRQGKANKVIAYELNISEGTVKVHLRQIMKKLHATNRTDVAVKSVELIDMSRLGLTGGSQSVEDGTVGKLRARI